jgi:hypothetical protein
MLTTPVNRKILSITKSLGNVVSYVAQKSVPSVGLSIQSRRRQLAMVKKGFQHGYSIQLHCIVPEPLKARARLPRIGYALGQQHGYSLPCAPLKLPIQRKTKRLHFCGKRREVNVRIDSLSVNFSNNRTHNGSSRKRIISGSEFSIRDPRIFPGCVTTLR